MPTASAFSVSLRCKGEPAGWRQENKLPIKAIAFFGLARGYLVRWPNGSKPPRTIEFGTNSVGYKILFLKQKATWRRPSGTGNVITYPYPSAILKSLVYSRNREYLYLTILQCRVRVMLKKNQINIIHNNLNRHYVFYSTLHFPPYRNRHSVHSCNWHEDGSLALLCTSFAVLQEQNKGRWLVIIRHSKFLNPKCFMSSLISCQPELNRACKSLSEHHGYRTKLFNHHGR